MKPDIATLVEMVAARMLVDKTMPDSTNVRNGWRTDALLIGDVDMFVVHQCNEPASYAQIGRQLADKVGHLPEMAALAWIAVFRGERLLPLDPEREEAIFRMVQVLKKDILALPEGTRKMRCASLLEYNEGIFFDACGRFDLAATAQKQSAEYSVELGDKAGEAIANYCEKRLRLKGALCKGLPDHILKELFVVVENFAEKLSEALEDSPLHTQWAEGNCLADLVQMCAWLNQTHPKWDTWVKTTLNAHETLGNAFNPSKALTLALAMERLRHPQSQIHLAAIANGDDINERRATAFLVLIRQALDEGKVEMAKAFVEKMPKQGAQHVCTVAKLLVASL